MVVFLSERIKRSSAEAEGVIAISPMATVRPKLSPDGTVLLLEFGQLLPGTTYTATLPGAAIEDLAGNTMASAFVVSFKTPAVPPASLAGAPGAVASLVVGSFTATLSRNSAENGLLTLHRVGDTDDVSPVGELRLPIFPRALVEVGAYSFRRRPNAAVETRRLIAITGGVVGTESVGPWLWLVDITDPSAPVRLASSLISGDPAQVAGILRYDAPWLAIGISGPEESLLNYVNLQGLILGSNAEIGDGTLVPNYIRGTDLNGDGDFVDDGETLPRPQIKTLFGTEFVIPLSPGRFLTDFDSRQGGQFAVAILGPRNGSAPRLQVIRANGLAVGLGSDDETEGRIEINTGTPRRVALDLDFPVTDAAGSKTVPVALVAVDSRVEIYDLTNPSNPVRLGGGGHGLDLTPHQGGNVFSLQRSDRDEYTVAGASGLFVVSRQDLGNLTRPIGVLEVHSGGAFSGRISGASPLAFTTTHGGLRILNRPPRIAVVRRPGQLVKSVAEVLALDEAGRREFLLTTVEDAFIAPVIFGEDPASLAPIMPPDPLVHHYIRVRAPGHLGSELKIAVESLDRSTNPNPGMGSEYPPVLLTDRASNVGLAPPVQPAVTALTLSRLSSDPSSELFNEFLSSPLLVVREKLSPGRLNAVSTMTGRQTIWSGSFLRFGFDLATAPDRDLAPFVASIASGTFKPGLSRTYLGLRPEFRESPNPTRPSAGVRIAGVDLQSGEYMLPEVDWTLDGRHQSLTLQRIYQSRSQYVGPFGRGWDHNYNARIFEIPADMGPGAQIPLVNLGDASLKASPEDVLLIDGAGSVHFYRRISDGSGNLGELSAYRSDPAIAEFVKPNGVDGIASFYESPRGVFTVLYKLKDGSWLAVGPTGQRILFRSDGRLDRLIGAFESSELICHYRADGLLDRVEGDRGVSLEFGYFFPFLNLRRGGADLVSEDPLKLGKIARVRSSSTLTFALEVRYDYDDRGLLAKVSPNLGRETVLVYDTANGDLLRRVGSGDGTSAPNQEISYDRDTGMVTGVSFGSQKFTFSGAISTARERFAGNGGKVGVTTNGKTTTYDVDRRGSPTGFNGRGFAADDRTGLPVRSDSQDQEIRIVHDTGNTVHRFRGNVIRTERGQPGQMVVTTTSYDGSAFNRPKVATNGDGAPIQYDYTEDGAGGLVVQERQGPVTRILRHDSYGQVLSQDQVESSGVTLTTQFQRGNRGYDRDLVVGNQFTTTSTTDRDVYGRPDRYSTGPLGYRLSYNADSQPEMQSSQAAPGLVPDTRYAYDSQLRLQEETVLGSGSSTETRYIYGDPRFPGKATQITQTETGLPPSTVRFTYNPGGQAETIVSDGETTTFDYDGALNTAVEGPGMKRQVEFLPNSRNVKSITENGITTRFTYDQGRVSSFTSGNLTTELDYDAPVSPSTLSERIRKRTLRAGAAALIEERFTYDGAGRLKSTESMPSGRIRDFEYYPDGELRELRINGQLLRSVIRDQSGRTLGTTLNNLRLAYSNFDPAGLPQTETLTFLGCLGTVTFQRTYDAIGRLRTSTIPGVGTIRYDYDSFGNLSSSADPDGVIAQQSSTPGGQPLRTTFTDGSSAAFSYDVHRRRLTIAGPTGTLAFGYDTEGLVSRIDYPDGTLARFENRNDFLTPERVIQGGQIQRHGYDSDGRIESIEVPARGDVMEYGYDELGRRSSSELNGVKVEFGYDVGGALASETTDAGTWSQTLNMVDQVVGESYPSGLRLEYFPDLHGLASSIRSVGITSILWFAAGLPAEIEYAGGIRQTRTYDTALRPTGFKWTFGSGTGAGIAAEYRYHLTPGGRVLHEERVHQAEFDVYRRNSPAEAMRVTSFFFGAANETGANSKASIQGLGFVNGELMGASSMSNAGLTGPDPRGYLPTLVRSGNRLIRADGSTIGHDAAGSMTNFPVWVVLPGQKDLTRLDAGASYDGFGMLRQVDRNDGVRVVYVRDGLGRVVGRTVSGPAERCRAGTTRFVWKGSLLIEEHEEGPAGSPVLVRRYVWLGRDLVRVQSAPAIGSALVDYIPITTLTRSVGGYLAEDGRLVETINYSAYGVPFITGGDSGGCSAVSQTLLFQGGLFDEATGLYQFGERNLHPMLGQFLQRDTALFAESLAWFTAFNGDPAGRIDPAGMESEGATTSLGYAKELKGQVEAARGLYAPGKKFMTALRDGNIVSAIDPAGDFLNKTIALGQTRSDTEVKDQFKNLGTLKTSIDAIRSGAGILESVLDMKRDRELLGAVEKLTRAEVSGLARAGKLKDLLSQGASAGTDRFSELRMEHSLGQVYRDAVKAKGDWLSPEDFRDATAKNVAQRRHKKLISIGQGFRALGGTMASQYIKGDDIYSERAKQYLGFQNAVLTVADKAAKALEDKDIAGLKMTLRAPFGSFGSVAANANARAAVSAAWTAGFEGGKLAVLFLADEDVAKAYLESTKTFEKNGGWLTVAGGVLSTFNLDKAAMAVQAINDQGIQDAAKETLQLLIDENRRQSARRDAYLNGISEP